MLVTVLISGEYSSSIVPGRVGIVCTDETEAETHQHSESTGDGRWIIAPPLCCPPPIISPFCDLQEALFRSCVGLYTLTNSGQMEVCGHYIHLISLHLVGELFQKAVAPLDFSGVWEVQKWFLIKIIPMEKKLPSFCQ